MGRVSRRSRAKEPAARTETNWQRVAALVIFGVLATGAPMAFGAVDRFTQIVLVGLLGIGVLLQPPQVARVGRWMNFALLALLALVVVKEFGPAKFFGHTTWRTTLEESYGLELPWTHHPEPARALEALLTVAVAAIWLVWVRSLASVRENRAALAWMLFGAGTLVAAVSFAAKGGDPRAIWGLRYTPGWRGFGPFPNRNHSACFFAMSAIVGAGCVTWAGMRRRYDLLTGGILMLGLVLSGLFATESRGGMVALGCGALVFVGFVLAKLRSRRAFGVALAALLVALAVALVFGSKSLARFSNGEGAHVSNQLRREIWHDGFAMWRDAPLFGHGLSSFAEIFPMYETMQLDDQVVLHPESSWLQWLDEMGAVPLLLGAGICLAFLLPHARENFRSRNTFYLRAGGFAATAALLAHSVIDVPAHRWGTVAFAIAAVGLACPWRSRVAASQPTRRPALLALGIAFFWSLPLLADWPAWSPLSLNRLLSKNEPSNILRLAEIERALHYFPLDAALHEAAGLVLLRSGGAPASEWQREFQIASRLVPSSWRTPAEQARATRKISPAFSLHAWQLAIERGAHQREELLGLAMRETTSNPASSAAWSSYVEAHPDLLLAYSRTAPEDLGRDAFHRWWEGRALTSAKIGDTEVRDFYPALRRWGTPRQLAQWMEHRPDLRARDARVWASIIVQWGDEAGAWAVLAAAFPEPEFPAPRQSLLRDDLERRWKSDARDLVNARVLAQYLLTNDEIAAGKKIILDVAHRRDAPDWFVTKAAHILAADGQLAEAIALLLHDQAK